MFDIERSVTIERSAEDVFAYVDDIRNLARHMSDGHAGPLMGSRLTLEILSAQATGIGAIYRYSGSVLGFDLDFSEVVTDYVVGREKAWRTLEQARILIVDSYVMRVSVRAISPVCAQLTIRFSYSERTEGPWRWFGKALAGPYGRWCLDNMTFGAKAALEGKIGRSPLEDHPWSRFSATQIALHWLIVLLIVEQYVTSAAILRTHAYRPLGKPPDTFDMTLHTAHTRIGLTIFGLIALRVALRTIWGAPPWVGGLPLWRRRLSTSVQFGLYGVLLAQAGTGAIASYLWWPMSIAHKALFWALLALVSLHLGGAVVSFSTRPRETLYRITGIRGRLGRPGGHEKGETR